MKVFPVIHINNTERAVHEAEVALDMGADGVYLIDHHGGEPDTTFEVFNTIDEHRPDAYVGVNLLGYSSTDVLKTMRDAHQRRELVRIPDGVWIDDVRHSGNMSPREVFEYKQNDSVLRSMRILGGIAFKYTRSYTDDPGKAQDEVGSLESAVDVVTTSGKGTGSAPSASKIRAMHEASTKPIAVASGISLDNIGDYRGFVDEILVASSVETAPYSGVFNQGELRAFIEAAHRD